MARVATESSSQRFDELRARLYEQNQFVIKYDLASMSAAAQSLGLRAPARRVVLVGGTNGKGTTCAALHAIAMRAGLRVGMYSSPHLINLRERIRVNGGPISTDDLCDTLEPIYRRFSGRDAPSEAPRALSYFEMLTLAAWSHFASADLDLAVFEVGLGGRLDATNVLSPDASIITSIALDHQDYLGDTIAAIAGEKAGISRAGRPTFVHPESGGHAELVHACAAHDTELVSVSGGSTPDQWNQGLAWAAFEHMFPNVADRAMRDEALARVRWPGRRQVFNGPDGRTFFLDGAHNPHAVAATSQWLRDEIDDPVAVIFGLSGNRDPLPLLALLKPFIDHLIVTECTEAPAVPAASIVDAAATLGIRTCVAASPEDAVSLVTGTAAVVGSLYLVGEVMAALGVQLEDLRIYADA